MGHLQAAFGHPWSRPSPFLNVAFFTHHLPCVDLHFRLRDEWPGVGVDPFVTDPSSEPVSPFPSANYSEDPQGFYVDGQFFTWEQRC